MPRCPPGLHCLCWVCVPWTCASRIDRVPSPLTRQGHQDYLCNHHPALPPHGARTRPAAAALPAFMSRNASDLVLAVLPAPRPSLELHPHHGGPAAHFTPHPPPTPPPGAPAAAAFDTATPPHGQARARAPTAHSLCARVLGQPQPPVGLLLHLQVARHPARVRLGLERAAHVAALGRKARQLRRPQDGLQRGQEGQEGRGGRWGAGQRKQAEDGPSEGPSRSSQAG